MSTQQIALDGFKLRHWLNARKFTNRRAAEAAGLTEDEVSHLASGNVQSAEQIVVNGLARALNLPASYLIADNEELPAVIYQSKEEVLATKREVNRGGFHFYNYYSLPSPEGYVAPVLIDILCPRDRDPVQNNGHLEPAITINLGPHHIYGLWGDKSKDDAWHQFDTNKSDEKDWIIGDSYVEPPYQPHSYSLAEDGPAQILSYTVKSNLEAVVNQTNAWADSMFEHMVDGYRERAPYAAILTQMMARRAYDVDSLAAEVAIGGNSLKAYLEGDEDALGVTELKAIGRCLGVDYRLLMAPVFVHDSVGKTWCSYKDSVRSIRPYKSYTVASMSAAPQHTDLMGLFMKVDNDAGATPIDLLDHSCSHYLVTGGDMVFRYLETDGSPVEHRIAEGDAMWVGPYIEHGFSGRGSLIKMGNGEGLSSLNQLEFSNTYALADTLSRCRKDKQVWGFDAKS